LWGCWEKSDDRTAMIFTKITSPVDHERDRRRNINILRGVKVSIQVASDNRLRKIQQRSSAKV
jgi:hypothetical protein